MTTPLGPLEFMPSAATPSSQASQQTRAPVANSMPPHGATPKIAVPHPLLGQTGMSRHNAFPPQMLGGSVPPNPRMNTGFQAPYQNDSYLGSNRHGRGNECQFPSRFSTAPVNAPPVWSSPFGSTAAAAFGQADPASVAGALAAAAVAESHVRKGIAAANSWWPSTVNKLRQYFAVSHLSARRKCLALLIPPLGYRHIWRLKSGCCISPTSSSRTVQRGLGSNDVTDYTSNANDEDGSNSTSGNSIQNINHLGPDLYLPLMAFMTYVLLCGVAKGALDKFHPEVLPSTASFAAIVTLLESGCTALIFYLLGVHHIPFLDILSIFGLKFESLVIIILVGLLCRQYPIVFGSIFLYCSLCASHATLQSLRGSEHRNRDELEWGTSSPFYGVHPTPYRGGYCIVVAIRAYYPVVNVGFHAIRFSKSTTAIFSLHYMWLGVSASSALLAVGSFFICTRFTPHVMQLCPLVLVPVQCTRNLPIKPDNK